MGVRCIVGACVEKGRGGRITSVEELHVIGYKEMVHRQQRSNVEKEKSRER